MFGMSEKAAWNSVSRSIFVAAFSMTLVVASAVPAAELTRVQINECNSSITIVQAPLSPTQGQTVNVTMTIRSTDARDNANNAIPQVFDKATYRGDCQTPPGIPCAPNSPANVSFLGNVGGTCPGINWIDMGNGVVEFDFVPDLSLLVTVNPGPVVVPASCTVSFDVNYAAAATYAIQGNTSGVCQNPVGNVNSDTTVTTALTVLPIVPTMGEFGLIALALVLLGGSWAILRRRHAATAP